MLLLLEQHRPYYESDHVLNIAYNVLCGGRTLDDIERRRNDSTYLDALGARAIPDPTTAGDFLINRGGNRPSHEGAAEIFDEAVDLCRRAGFVDILLRGDSAFSLTKNFDRWTDDGVRFVFGYLAAPTLKTRADELPDAEFELLVRKADLALAEVKTRRAKQPRVKEAIVRKCGYKNLRLESEELAEFEHKPANAKRACRMVVLRKNLVEAQGELFIGNSVRYFFYVTNDDKLSPAAVVREANHRCNRENLIAQLKPASGRCTPRSTRSRPTGPTWSWLRWRGR